MKLPSDSISYAIAAVILFVVLVWRDAWIEAKRDLRGDDTNAISLEGWGDEAFTAPTPRVTINGQREDVIYLIERSGELVITRGGERVKGAELNRILVALNAAPPRVEGETLLIFHRTTANSLIVTDEQDRLAGPRLDHVVAALNAR